MSVLVNILTTYNGAGAKKAMRDMAVMQKQATLSGAKMSAGLLAASAAMQRRGAVIASTGALMSKRLTLPVLAFAGASVYAAQTVDKGLNCVRAPAPARPARSSRTWRRRFARSPRAPARTWRRSATRWPT